MPVGSPAQPKHVRSQRKRGGVVGMSERKFSGREPPLAHLSAFWLVRAQIHGRCPTRAQEHVQPNPFQIVSLMHTFDGIGEGCDDRHAVWR